MLRQQLLLKRFIVDVNNRPNGVFSSFDSFSSEFSPDNRLIDIFANYIFFYFINRKNKENRKVYICKLDAVIFEASLDFRIFVIVLDTSIKNQVTILIAYIYTHNSLVVKTIYHAINITLMEAKLFTVRCSINQAICYNSKTLGLINRKNLVLELI